MSRLRLRRARQWARYVNRYAHIGSTYSGSTSLSRVLWRGMLRQDPGTYKHIRRQAKRRIVACAPYTGGGSDA